MVYHHLLTLIRCKNRFHLIKTAGTIEIQTENQICISKGCFNCFRLLIIANNFFCSRKPTYGIWYHIWYTDCGILVQGLQIIKPAQGRTYRITIR